MTAPRLGPGDREVLDVPDRAALRAWLERHHERRESVWLRLRKGAPDGTLSYDEAVEEGLCFGWIDSTSNRYDESSYLVLYAPRKRGSGWSRSNKRRLERLEAQGLVHPAGRAVLDAARADGSWTLLDSAEAGEVPGDLAAALRDGPAEARAQWDAFSPSAQKRLLSWVALARRPRTRADRIARIVADAAEGREANQWRPGR